MYDFMDDVKTQEILETRGWSYKLVDNDTAVLIQRFSPAGEDISIEVDRDNAISGIVSFAEDFDVDEHVELWIANRGKNGVPSTIRELLEDSEAIFKELAELAREINK